MRSSFIKVTTTNAVREENERERKERRESEREKERKERLFCDVKRFSAALLLFSVKEYFVWCWGKGHVTNILIKTRARTLFSTALKRARKRTEKAAQREHLNDNISISSKSSACASKASFVLHHLHPLKSRRRKRRFGKLRRILSLGQRTMMEKKDEQESQHHRTF